MLDFGEVCIYMLVKGVFGNVKIFLEHKNVKNLVMLQMGLCQFGPCFVMFLRQVCFLVFPDKCIFANDSQ